jgi:hypothetical protein
MPHISFLGNYLFRMYEIHAQYNWMFPLHVIFPHNLHLRLRPYASAKQGHALDVSFTHVIFPHNLHLRLRPYASAKQGHALDVSFTRYFST